MRLYDQLQERLGGIYQIINIQTLDFYVGSTNNFKRRLNEHSSCLRFGRGPLVLQRAWNKYGDSVFEFRVLEVVTDTTHKNLLDREQYYIDKLKPKYNAYPLAVGMVFTDELRDKVSAGLRRVFTKQDFSKRAEKMVEYNKTTQWFNSPENKKMMSSRSKENWKNEEYRNKVLNSESRGNRILSKNDVIKIRELHNTEHTTCKNLSVQFGVSISTIKAIISYRNWKNIS